MISMRILLVEDDDGVRYLFKRFIGDLCSYIAETGYLGEALAFCRRENFDVIVLDLVLFDSDKAKSLAAIKGLKKTSGASLMVVTGVPDPDIERQARDAGADYVVPKGVEFSKTSRAILMALHAAVLKHPRQHPGDDYLHHVAMLEKLVRSAA